MSRQRQFGPAVHHAKGGADEYPDGIRSDGGVVPSGDGARARAGRPEPDSGVDDGEPGLLHGLPQFGYGPQIGRRRAGRAAWLEYPAAAHRQL